MVREFVLSNVQFDGTYFIALIYYIILALYQLEIYKTSLCMAEAKVKMIQVTDDFVKKMFLTSQSILHLLLLDKPACLKVVLFFQIRCKNIKWDGDTV